MAGVLLSAVPVAHGAPGAGINAHPIRLVRPPGVPLSAMAQLGRQIFFDRSLSSSGRLSCAVCHSPQHAYGPPGDLPVMNGGAALRVAGLRAVPSLRYLDRQPNFSIGPENGEVEGPVAAVPSPAAASARVRKTATATAQSASNVVPQGGLFWDGRADTLQNQAFGPLLNPAEMDGGSVAAVAAKIRRAPYAAALVRFVGPAVSNDARLLVAEALFAVARYQIEARDFHPYTSKYDFWLEGRARLTPSEARGLRLFTDPQGPNCSGCHLAQPSPDGLPPLFTDHQFEALGVPRNRLLVATRNPHFFDLGICGPVRTDLRNRREFCGMFATPSLRNVATRHVFFHNGTYHSLRQVVDFYDFRDTRPERVFPRDADGKVQRFDDLPAAYRKNVDRIDPPFDREAGERPVLSPSEERDVIDFLGTLTDGYRPERAP